MSWFQNWFACFLTPDIWQDRIRLECDHTGSRDDRTGKNVHTFRVEIKQQRRLQLLVDRGHCTANPEQRDDWRGESCANSICRRNVDISVPTIPVRLTFWIKSQLYRRWQIKSATVHGRCPHCHLQSGHEGRETLCHISSLGGHFCLFGCHPTNQKLEREQVRLFQPIR